MESRPFRSLSSGIVLRTLDEEISHGRRSTAKILGLIAEVDARQLYREAGYPSLYDFCTKKLGFSEDEASRRIHASKAARRFPIIFELIADGRLHLSGIKLLRPRLTPATVSGLLRASIHKSTWEIRQLLAERFPQPDVPTQVVALVPSDAELPNSGNCTQAVASQTDEFISPVLGPVKLPKEFEDSSPGPAQPGIGSSPPSPIELPTTPRVAPLSAEKYSLQLTLRKTTHDKMRRLQELLGSRVFGGDLDAVLEHAFDMAIAQLEKRKLAATDKPRVGKPSNDPRYIPARVKRGVRERDKDRCAFVGDNGHRCEARSGLEFDHIEPVARGGESTVANVRLLCRAHNQLAAERVFGHALVEGKHQAAADRAGRAQAAP